MKKNYGLFLITLAIIILCGVLKSQILRHGRIMNLSEDLISSKEFRQMELTEEALSALRNMESSGYSKGCLLAALLPWNDFRTPPKAKWNPEVFSLAYEEFSTYRPGALLDFQDGAAAVWDDIQTFPVSCPVVFENSWMFERNFGGKRGHEGCDLMPPKNRREFYPVLSMTDGVVEKIGWLTKGGYRIGIRSFHGGYFYYAHLSSYAKDFQIGDIVSSGDTLGYMGDTGYGPEGTVGQFDVHLHLGIYINGKDNNEISINPYWILKYLQ